MVVVDFVTRRIAPLQAHSVPMWMYSGPSDKMRLHVEDNDKDTIDNILSALLSAPQCFPWTSFFRRSGPFISTT